MTAVGSLDCCERALADVGQHNVPSALQSFGPNVSEHQRDDDTYYLTTAINYTNGPPHIGHAYEAIVSDVLARYHRIYGRDVFFVTGTDEHGQKIATTAASQRIEPIQLCDHYAEQFKALNRELKMSYDYFIRTTSSAHKAGAQRLWERAHAKGDIYLGKYVGWYNVREETFVTERDAAASEYKDPEVSYFFKMSQYQEALIHHIQTHPEFIQPEFRRNEILARLKEPLEDLSVSRTTFSWGIPVPHDPKHVMYVWFDALSNYLTALDYFTENEKRRFWPANCHVIGKDIIWFHCVIWPCMLMSAEIPLPRSVIAHGFVLAGDGRKMSKSLGNVVDPVELVKTLPNVDILRFFILKVAEVGRDIRFDLNVMNDIANSDLADTLGNMVHRATGLCMKYCHGRIPECPLPEGEPPFDFDALVLHVETLMQRFALQEALEALMSACRDTNKYLTDKAPWAIADTAERHKICRAILEAVYMLAHFLEPYIPVAAEEIFKRLGNPRKTLRTLSGWFDNLSVGAPVAVGDVLFVKRETKTAHTS